MLKEWDFNRFFPKQQNSGESHSLKSSEPKLISSTPNEKVAGGGRPQQHHRHSNVSTSASAAATKASSKERSPDVSGYKLLLSSSSSGTRTPSPRAGTAAAPESAGGRSNVAELRSSFQRQAALAGSVRRREPSSSFLSVLPRVFRRENTDFLPSVRHSSVFIDANVNFASNGNGSAEAAEASSKRRGSDASQIGAGAKQAKIAAASRAATVAAAAAVVDDSSSAASVSKSMLKARDWKPTRPRRERTDGDIMTRRNRAQQDLKENLEARRLGIEQRFSAEANKMRNRNSGVLISQQNLNSSSNQSDDSTCNIQVSTFFPKVFHLFFFFFFSLFFL